MSEWFYDKNGCAVLFRYDDRLISKSGQNLCWIINGCLYSLRGGRHIGWFEDGKIFDIDNGVLAFSRDANNLPYRPGIGGTPGTPGIPGKPGRPGIGGRCGRPRYHGYSGVCNVLDYFLKNQ